MQDCQWGHGRTGGQVFPPVPISISALPSFKSRGVGYEAGGKRLKVVVLQPAVVSIFGCFVFEFWVLRFRDLGASCFGLCFQVLRFRDYFEHRRVPVGSYKKHFLWRLTTSQHQYWMRPITTLSPFSKVLERLVYNQLYPFIDKHQILYKYQFGKTKSIHQLR